MSNIEETKINEAKQDLLDQYTDKFLSELQTLRDKVVKTEDIESAIDDVLSGNSDGDASEILNTFDQNTLKQLASDVLIWGSTVFDELFSNTAESDKQQALKEKIKNYLTSEWFWDMLEDKIVNHTKFALYFDNMGDEWKPLFDKLQRARELFVGAKTMEDLQLLQKELNLYNEDVTVPDDQFYQDNSEYQYNPIDLSGKEHVLFDSINSKPYSYNTKTNVTWCSYTARLNANEFGIKVPSGNAFDAKDKSPIDTKFLSSIEKDEKQEFSIKEMQSLDPAANAADVYVYSQWKYAKYGHRCFMIKNVSDGEWYVLDPYRQPDPWSKKAPEDPKSLAPKPLEEYLKYNKIAKINFYNSPVAVVDNLDNLA